MRQDLSDSLRYILTSMEGLVSWNKRFLSYYIAFILFVFAADLVRQVNKSASRNVN